MVVKSVVDVTDDTWRAFKALAAERGMSVQGLLGGLVATEVRADQRKKARNLGRSQAAKTARRKFLADLEAEKR